MSGEVDAGGDPVGEFDEGDTSEIITGFNVWTYEEDGTAIGVEFYPVHMDTTTWEDDSEEVLENIRRDYPAGEWQNHNW